MLIIAEEEAEINAKGIARSVFLQAVSSFRRPRVDLQCLSIFRTDRTSDIDSSAVTQNRRLIGIRNYYLYSRYL